MSKRSIHDMPTVRIAGPESKPFWKSEWFLELIACFPPILLSLLTLIQVASDNAGLATLPGIALVWLVAQYAIKIFHEAQTQTDDSLTDDLTACAVVAHRSIARACGLEVGKPANPNCLRVTIHRTTRDDPPQLEQAIGYVGGTYNGKGRRFEMHAGVIGEAIQQGAPLVAARTDESIEAYRSDLVKRYRFTPTEAEARCPTQFSFMAAPIMGIDGAIGAIYVDSCQKDVFTHDDSLAPEVFSGICEGIVQYIRAVHLPKRGTK